MAVATAVAAVSLVVVCVAVRVVAAGGSAVAGGDIANDLESPTVVVVAGCVPVAVAAPADVAAIATKDEDEVAM